MGGPWRYQGSSDSAPGAAPSPKVGDPSGIGSGVSAVMAGAKSASVVMACAALEASAIPGA